MTVSELLLLVFSSNKARPTLNLIRAGLVIYQTDQQEYSPGGCNLISFPCVTENQCNGTTRNIKSAFCIVIFILFSD